MRGRYAHVIMKITNDSLIAAMFLFEQENGNKLDRNSIQDIEKEGLVNSNPSELVDEIKNYLESASNDDPLVGTAIFALSKRYDQSLKALFVRMLKRTLNDNPHALYQTLIALENLEENIFQGDSCVNEYARNKRIAEEYLKREA